MDRSKLSSAGLWIFAAIGAIASLITIVGFLKPSTAQLEVSVYPNQFAVPNFIESVLSDNIYGNGADLVEKIAAGVCVDKQKVDHSYKVVDKNDPVCKNLSDIKIASNQISRLQGSYLYDMRIVNTGSSVAKGIKLNGSYIVAADMFVDENELIKNPVTESGSYKVPDMNPGDEIKILVWSRLPTYDFRSFYDFEKIPRITYENGSIEQNTYIHAPRMYADTYDFMNSFHWSIQAFIIFVAALLIVLPTVLILSTIEALVKGKPLSSVFQTTTPVASENPE